MIPAAPDTGQSTGSHRFQTGRVVTLATGHAVHDTYTGFLPLLSACS